MGRPAYPSRFLASALLLAGFAVRGRRAVAPLIDLSIFKVRNVSGANGMMAAVFAGNLGMFFLLTLYLQGVEHYSAVRTGLAFLPFPVILGFVSTRMARLMPRFGFRPFLVLGPALVVLGMAWLCFLPVHGSYLLHVLPGLVVMPVGYGMSFAPMYAAATAGIPHPLRRPCLRPDHHIPAGGRSARPSRHLRCRRLCHRVTHPHRRTAGTDRRLRRRDGGVGRHHPHRSAARRHRHPRAPAGWRTARRHQRCGPGRARRSGAGAQQLKRGVQRGLQVSDGASGHQDGHPASARRQAARPPCSRGQGGD
jgi:hypothetical protein